jgi:hypothetical protein
MALDPIATSPMLYVTCLNLVKIMVSAMAQAQLIILVYVHLVSMAMNAKSITDLVNQILVGIMVYIFPSTEL